VVAAAANGAEENNVLFKDPGGVLAGARWADSARMPAARPMLAA
jgi:hypothetical protein